MNQNSMNSSHFDADEQPNRVPHEVKVSVVIITYNHRKYIKQALESVLMQNTSFDFEILIGEDDSTDGTREICVEYAARHPGKIRLFLRSESNKIYINNTKTGRYNSQKTREAARGEYLAVLEGDDFWIDPEKLQKQYDYLRVHPEESICGTRCLFWTGEESVEEAKISPNYNYLGHVTREDLCSSKTWIHTSTYMCRRDPYVNMARWTRQVLDNDLAVIVCLSRKTGRVPFLNIITSVYRITGTGVWSSASSMTTLERKVYFWRTYYNHAVKTKDRPEIKISRKMFLRLNKSLKNQRLRGRWYYRLWLLGSEPRLAISVGIRKIAERLRRGGNPRRNCL